MFVENQEFQLLVILLLEGKFMLTSRGFLTGKILNKEDIPKDDFRNHIPRF